MKIYIGSDHAGFEMKSQLVTFLQDECNAEVEDLGAFSFDSQDDYPDFILPVARAVAGSVTSGVEDTFGVVLGGSGQGEAIVANRVPGVRAIVYYGYDMDIVRLGREHNDANILSLGARFISADQAREALKIFLDTEFSHEERHKRRIAKVDQDFA